MGEPTPPEYGLTTIVDREITDAMRGQVAQLPDRRAARATGAAPELEPQGAASGVPYGQLCETNPEYLGDFWKACRALYAGGARLLRDEQLMRQLFPPHSHEAPDVYAERRSRAFYIAYAGEIIDHLIAGFAHDPIRLTAGLDEDTDAERDLPDWWSDFAQDVSPPGGTRQSIGAFAVDCLREMFVTQTAWVLIDLPPRDPNAQPPASRLEEERAGLLDPYLCLMPTDHVVDWQIDDDTGELEWVLCHWRSKRRAGLRDSRSAVTERWLYWTPAGWERYELTWDPATPPKPDTPVPLVAEGTHPFGAVPFVRIQLPEGLYAMGKLESVAREHFNKRCAASWAEYKSLFAVLYEFMAPEQQGAFTPHLPAISQIQQDPRRAVNQTRGQGYSQLRGHQDRAEYVGPDAAPFKEARESCAELMREMHRVMFSMALSANMDSKALQRSGQSKQKDSEQIAAILAKVGEIIREGIDAVLDVISALRKESERAVSSTGGEKFDADSISDAITDAVTLLSGVPMKSPTFLKRYLYRVYKLALGPSATQDDLEDIRDELDTVITAESMIAADPTPPTEEDSKDPEDGDQEDDDDREDPAPPKPAPPPPPRPGMRRLIAT
jgi:hypothetical protein